MGKVNSIESHLAKGWQVNDAFNEIGIQIQKFLISKVKQIVDKQELERIIHFYYNYSEAFNDTSHNRMTPCLNKSKIDHHLKFNYYGISK